MLAFFAVVVVLSIALHVVLGMRLLGPFDLTPARHAGLWVAVGVSAVVVPGTFLLLPQSGRTWADVLQWIGYLWMGLFSLILVGLVFRDVGWLVAMGLGSVPEDPERRRLLLGALNLGVLGLAGGLGAVAFAGSRRLAEVVRVTLPIEDLPEALDGFRIAQISDLHVGPTIRADDIRAVVDRVNELDPHFVALTGDLVDGPVGRLAEHVAPLADLKSTHGTWFVTGNHEYYSGVHAWIEHVRDSLGMTVLLDEHAVVEHEGASILVAGITDRTSRMLEPSHTADVRKAAADAPATDLRLLLAHQPEAAPLAEELGFHVLLSGHTHGGQYVPFTWLIRLIKRWVSGLYRHGGLWVYVNPGTTWWGPPMRLGSPQEITLLELTRA